ncbi:MAG: SycD/LcrH family type III secretion system chaperone [Parachlamydiaceae bacterium]|nr:SycD/LcrH family type III secretion system chaperone [Parachlamydiaceae bacterium]
MKGSRGMKKQMKKEAFDDSQVDPKQFARSMKEVSDKLLKQGLPAKDAFGMSNQLLEGMYAQAYRLYNTGKYVEATHLFRLLILLDPIEAKYVLGLAACFHMLKEYKNAVQTYTMCAILDPKSPIPHYHSSDCFIQIKEYVSAMVCLELAIKKAGDQPEYAKMKERAILSLESIKTQLQAESSNKESA